MLIIEIALGIVLAALILANLDLALVISGLIVILFMIFGSLSGLLLISHEFISELPLVLKVIPILIGFFCGLFVMGLLAEKLLNLKSFFSITLTRFPKLSQGVFYYFEYFLHRIWLGSAHAIILAIMFIFIAQLLNLILNLKKLNLYYAMFIVAIPYIFLIAYRICQKPRVVK